MGVLLDKPKTDKYNETGHGNGLKYGVSSMQGWRVTMEDAHTAITELPDNFKEWSFFGVFDGHAGASLSELCATELLKYISETEEFKNLDPLLPSFLPDIERGIRNGFLSMDKKVWEIPNLASGEDKSGSTAVCVFITPTHMFFANCGDSRAILVRNGKVFFSTIDHKPDDPAEKQRIQNAGGSVIVQRVNGSLAVSRSLGDYAYKAVPGFGPTEQLISPEPEITVFVRNQKEDELIVLACDGVWDVCSNDELCSFLQNRIRCADDLSLICNETLDMCLLKGSVDNMSIILVAFDTVPIVDPKAKEEDEHIDSVVMKKTQEFIQSQNNHVNVDAILEHLESFFEPVISSDILLSKLAKIQDVIHAQWNSRLLT